MVAGLFLLQFFAYKIREIYEPKTTLFRTDEFFFPFALLQTLAREQVFIKEAVLVAFQNINVF
jgi:hypothetical protein